MKEVIAVIRMNTMNQTKQALTEVGVSSFTAVKVLGRGKDQVDYGLLRGAEEGYEEAIVQLGHTPRLIPKRLLSIVISDEKVPVVVDAIMEVNRTNRPGDGKVFIMPVSDAIRVRTGETGDEAVDEVAR